MPVDRCVLVTCMHMLIVASRPFLSQGHEKALRQCSAMMGTGSFDSSKSSFDSGFPSAGSLATMPSMAGKLDKLSEQQ